MKVAALAGGVGGAKLADGLARLDPALDLTVIVNTGDDFTLFGLWISPDLDTVCYNLAGIANLTTGWGRQGESWETFEELRRLGGADWFKLGDRDLATHLERTRRLNDGERLSAVTADFCKAWGVAPLVLPMSDDPVPTMIRTDQGLLPFQDYFVRQACAPAVEEFIFQEADRAQPAPGVLEAVKAADLVVVCPSNPWVSIAPILAVPGIRTAVAEKPVLAVSPLIGSEAVKGPAAKMYREMGFEPSAAAVAAHYGSLLDGIVIDDRDQGLRQTMLDQSGGRLKVYSTDIWMRDLEERIGVAERIMDFGRQLIKES